MRIVPLPQSEIRIATPLAAARRSYVQVGRSTAILDALERDMQPGDELDAILGAVLEFCEALDDGMTGTVVLLPEVGS